MAERGHDSSTSNPTRLNPHQLTIDKHYPDREWFQYQVDEKALGEPGFRLRPVPPAVRTSAEARTARVTLPARSLTALSTYRLAPEASGVIAEEGAGIPRR